MHISNRFVNACNIQIVIRMLHHSFKRVLLLRFFYLMVKSRKRFVKIGSRLQVALFYFIEVSNPCSPRLFRLPAYLILSNVPTLLPLLRPSVYSGPNSRFRASEIINAVT